MVNKLVNYLLLKPKFGKWQTYSHTKKLRLPQTVKSAEDAY